MTLSKNAKIGIAVALAAVIGIAYYMHKKKSASGTGSSNASQIADLKTQIAGRNKNIADETAGSSPTKAASIAYYTAKRDALVSQLTALGGTI